MRSVSRPRLQDGRTALRPNIESFQPNDPRGRRTWRQAGSDDLRNPAGPHPRTQPPANASSRPYSSSPAGPRSLDASASTREDSNTTPLQRKTFVPSERPPCRVPVESLLRSSRRTTSMDTSSADDRPILVNGKAPWLHQPTGLRSQHLVPSKRSTVRSGRTPAGRSVRSSTTMEGGLRFASPNLSHTLRPAQRTEPTPSAHHPRRITPYRWNAIHSSCSRDATPKHFGHRIAIASDLLTRNPRRRPRANPHSSPSHASLSRAGTSLSKNQRRRTLDSPIQP